jgi:hypothetical protein
MKLSSFSLWLPDANDSGTDNAETPYLIDLVLGPTVISL